ncbi:hypothetical protein FF1_008175 [Malus domestica]
MIPLSIDYASVTIHLSISGFNEVFPFFYADDDVHASFLYIDPENQVGLSHYQFIRIILIFRIFLYKLLGPNQSEAVVVLFTGDSCILDYFSFMFSAPIPTSWGDTDVTTMEKLQLSQFLGTLQSPRFVHMFLRGLTNWLSVLLILLMLPPGIHHVCVSKTLLVMYIYIKTDSYTDLTTNMRKTSFQK